MRLALTIILCLTFMHSYAQTRHTLQDSTGQSDKRIVQSVRTKLSSAKDSARQFFIKHETRPKKNIARLDSLASDPILFTDTIISTSSPNQQTNNVTSSEAIISAHEIQSAKADARLNSINEKPTQTRDKIEKGIEDVNTHLDKIENKADNAFSKATDGTVKRPGGDVSLQSDLNLQGKDVSLESINPNMPEINSKLPDADKLNVDPNLNLANIESKVGVEVPGEVKNISDQISGIDGKLAAGEQYENEIRDIAEGDLSSTEKLSGAIENEAMKLEPVSDLSSELQKATAQQQQYAALIQKYKDKKAVQAEVERKVKNIANEKINQFSPEFKDAQKQLSKAKKLNGSVTSFRKMKMKRPNEMKGKPFHEHLLPGLTIQAFSENKIFISDWGGQLGYKLSGRWLVGAGGIYRTNFSQDYKYWVKNGNVYGYRGYVNFNLVKTFYVHAEYSALFGDLKVKTIEVPNSKSYNGYVGLGKRYNISQKLQGSILAIYCAHLDGASANVSKFAMRIEFNYLTQKRKKLY